MALRGQVSIAHDYDGRGQCIFCHMYKNNVEILSHVCTPAREAEADKAIKQAVLETELDDVKEEK